MRRPDGQEHAGSGEYTVFDPPRRLALQLELGRRAGAGSAVAGGHHPDRRDGVTEAVLNHAGLADAESAEGHAEG